MASVVFVAESGDVKLTRKGLPPVAATYATINGSCPTSCALRVVGDGSACYGRHGNVAMVSRRCDESHAARPMTPAAIAREEAKRIDSFMREGIDGRRMRLHVAGDARTYTAAATLAAAVGRWLDRGGGAVWSFTHAWGQVPRAAWGRVSVLASCESFAQADAAMAQGWAAAVVVAKHNGPKAYKLEGYAHAKRAIPCPSQTTEGVTCQSCGLCADDAKLRAIGAVIAFEAHSGGRKRALTVLQ